MGIMLLKQPKTYIADVIEHKCDALSQNKEQVISHFQLCLNI